jgi:hypothetical protein
MVIVKRNFEFAIRGWGWPRFDQVLLGDRDQLEVGDADGVDRLVIVLRGLFHEGREVCKDIVAQFPLLSIFVGRYCCLTNQSNSAS